MNTLAWPADWLRLRAPAGTEAPCYWFLREIYRVVLGVGLPEGDMPPDVWTAQLTDAQGAPEWEQTAPEPFAVALLHDPEAGRWHLGVCVGDGTMLSCTHAGVLRIPLARVRRHVIGTFRYRRAG